MMPAKLERRPSIVMVLIVGAYESLPKRPFEESPSDSLTYVFERDDIVSKNPATKSTRPITVAKVRIVRLPFSSWSLMRIDSWIGSPPGYGALVVDHRS